MGPRATLEGIMGPRATRSLCCTCCIYMLHVAGGNIHAACRKWQTLYMHATCSIKAPPAT